MRSRVLLPFIVAFSLIPGLLHAQCLPGWGYYMPITVSNANASPLTNFEVELTVDTATPIGAGQMLASGADVRFTDVSCNPVEYWIESGLNTATTSIWVKVPSLPASGSTTLRMYYDNPAAAPAANGDAVFLFFDEFSGAALDGAKWTVRGTPSTLSQSGGILTLAGNNNWEYIRSNTTWSGPVVIESREYSQGVSAAMVLGYAGTDNRFTFRANGAVKGTTEDPDVSSGNAWFDMTYPAVPHPGASYNDFEIATDLVASAINISSFCNRTTANCNSTLKSLNLYTGGAYYVGFSSYNASFIENVDWVFARSFVATQPTSSNGTPQANAAPSTTTLGSSLNPSLFGQSVTLTADVTGSSPTGSVTFLDGATPLGTVALSSGQAILMISTLTVGSHPLTAAYGGDVANLPSTSAQLDQVVNPLADLSITKTDGVTTATPGGSVTYTITASNAGPSNTAGATVADTFPASLTATWTCVGAGGGTCTAAGAGNINDTVNLPSGGSVTYTVNGTISGAATGTLDNTATVTAPAGVTDLTPGNNSATDSDTLGASTDVSIVKTLNTVGPYIAGQSITYTLFVANAGPSTATSVQVTDTPTNVAITNVSGGGCSALPCTIATLASGANATITVIATISAAGPFDNAASVSAAQADGAAGNNTDNSGNGGAAAAAAAAPIPALSDWALMLLGLVLGLSGWWALRLKS